MKISKKFEDLDLGVTVEITRDEAEQLGFYQEDAISFEEAALSGWILGVDDDGNPVFEGE
jgi:hypothetical protein